MTTKLLLEGRLPFLRPTLSEIYSRIQGDIKNALEDPQTLLRISALLILAKAESGAIHLNYGFLQYMKEQIFALTADTENLQNHGDEYGISKKEGDKSSGNVVITGTAGLVIPALTQLQSSSGNRYYIDFDTTIGGSGSVTTSITAVDYGDSYDESGSITLSFVSPISGVNSNVTVDSSGLTGGLDEESDEDYRARILLRKRRTPHGGADFDYETWMLEISGVTRAWSIPQMYGSGTIGCAFVRDDDTPIIPTSTQIEEVRQYILSHTDPLTNTTVGAPVTAEPGIIMISLNELAINFNIEIYPNTADVQASVQSRLSDLINTYGGPEQLIALSQMTEAIGSAVGEVRHRIVSPTDDVRAAVNQIHTLGSLTFSTYG